MVELNENTYNIRLGRDEPKLKVWRSAGLMLTYKCPAACEFCYYNCGPDKKGLMAIDTAIAAWQSLNNLTGRNSRVHITGGEAFLYFDHLAELMVCAGKLSLTPLDLLETNAFWAVEDKIILERLKFLDSVGLKRLKISWDPFHAEYIEIEPVKRLAQAALDFLGPDRVLVRWEKYLQEPVKMSGLSPSGRQDQYKLAMEDYLFRLTGRAGGQLAELFADKTVDSLASCNCKSAFLGAKGVHIDPFGNVFSGLCSGIIIGNIDKTPLENIWKQFEPKEMNFVGTLFERGPVGLLERAVESGYQVKKYYADKCHLCTELRQFFFDIGEYKQIIGPEDCYYRKR